MAMGIDTGCGISADKLATVFEAKASTKAYGSGIGLAHAKTMIKNMGGEINIISTIGIGTTVSIILPSIPAPRWFASHIDITESQLIVVLDDDESIHGTWDTRIKGHFPSIEIIHFRRGQDFVEWYRAHKNQDILVLSDYELLGELKTGLDILEEFKIKNAVLITSHYEKEDILKRCVSAQIRLLPKNLVTYIPLTLKIVKEESSTPELVDCILIDDDPTIRGLWVMKANFKSKKLIVFDSIASANKKVFDYDRSTPIYIDSNFENEQNGEDYAKLLYEKGFKTIYLATGHDPSQFKLMYWITAIVPKNVPF
jgi:hypothetical protein